MWHSCQADYLHKVHTYRFLPRDDSWSMISGIWWVSILTLPVRCKRQHQSQSRAKTFITLLDFTLLRSLAVFYYYYKSKDFSDASQKVAGALYKVTVCAVQVALTVKKSAKAVSHCNDSWNKWALAARRKAISDEAALVWGGRQFQARAAATGNARSPRVDRRVDGTCSVVVSAERRRRRARTSDVGHRLSDRHAGAAPCIQRHARTHNPNRTRPGTRSQRRPRSNGAMCSDDRREQTRRAAAPSTDRSQPRRHPEAPTRTELHWSSLVMTSVKLNDRKKSEELKRTLRIGTSQFDGQKE